MITQWLVVMTTSKEREIGCLGFDTISYLYSFLNFHNLLVSAKIWLPDVVIALGQTYVIITTIVTISE